MTIRITPCKRIDNPNPISGSVYCDCPICDPDTTLDDRARELLAKAWMFAGYHPFTQEDDDYIAELEELGHLEVNWDDRKFIAISLSAEIYL